MGCCTSVEIRIYNVSPDPECIICMDNFKNVVLYPCGHLSLCKNCYLKLPLKHLGQYFPKRECPTCRGRIESYTLTSGT